MKNAYALLGEVMYICVLNSGASIIFEAVNNDVLFAGLYLPQLQQGNDYQYLSVKVLNLDIIKNDDGEYIGIADIQITDELPEWFDLDFDEEGDDRENQVISGVNVGYLADSPDEICYFWVR